MKTHIQHGLFWWVICLPAAVLILPALFWLLTHGLTGLTALLDALVRVTQS